MTQADWIAARDLTSTARLLKDDLPDGMWEQIKAAIQEYNETDKTTADKLAYITTLNEIMAEYGFPTSPITPEHNG